MKSVTRVLMLASGILLLAALPEAQDDKPEWAYAVAPPNPEGRAQGGARAAGTPAARAGRAGRSAGLTQDEPAPEKFTLPGSRFSFTMSEVRSPFAPADWFPEDHPPMPEIVAHGRQPDARACAFCHMPNGKGRPENGPVAGLSKEYIIQQLSDFKSGARKTAEPKKPNDMQLIAERMTDEDIQQSATYFSSMKWTPWIRVVETNTVKTTRISGQIFHLVDDGNSEPIGVRIVEVAEKPDEEPWRSPRSGFVAYVPVGAIKRGEALVTTGGGGKTVACIACHGVDLAGVGPIPGLAGRSPSYMARQIYDFKQRTRAGALSALMKPVVEKLTAQDIVDIVAYTASRTP